MKLVTLDWEQPFVIRSFRHRGLRRLFVKDDRSAVGANMIDAVERILATLDQAATLDGIDLPRYRLHPLKGNLEGFWAVTVRANWRITFRFVDGDAWEVDLVDYH